MADRTTEGMSTQLPVEEALTLIERALKISPNRPWRLTVAIDNPGPAIFEMKKDGRVVGILVGGHADAAIDAALSSTSTKESE